MGKIFDQTIAEIKHLPLMLGKLIGGLAAAIGFTTAVIKTRSSGWSIKDILLYLLIGSAGCIIFTLSARSLKRRLSTQAIDSVPFMNVLSWALLLLFAGIFLAGIYFFTT